MSVIVLGMEMPSCCSECELNYDSLGCSAIRSDGAFDRPGFDMDTERLPNCPLRPLPEKHGRLIDADDYAAEMKERQADAMLWKEKAARNNDMTIFARGDQAMRTFSEAKLTLDNMETIVEAEGY